MKKLTVLRVWKLLTHDIVKIFVLKYAPYESSLE